MLLLFADAVLKLFMLMKGLAKMFSKMTASLGDNNIKKERGGKDNTEMVLLLLLLFSAAVHG